METLSEILKRIDQFSSVKKKKKEPAAKIRDSLIKWVVLASKFHRIQLNAASENKMRLNSGQKRGKRENKIGRSLSSLNRIHRYVWEMTKDSSIYKELRIIFLEDLCKADREAR